ncbi:MAG: hypothetical protein Q9196_007231 [Gyalolechia fulgens]
MRAVNSYTPWIVLAALTSRAVSLPARDIRTGTGPDQDAPTQLDRVGAEIKHWRRTTEQPPAPENQGQWSEIINFPLVPVSTAIIAATGEVLLWSAWSRDKFLGNGGAGQTATAIFNPTTGSVTESIVTNTEHDMFCPGISLSASGLIVVTGGNNAEKTSIYHPDTNTWSSAAPLAISRGYNAQVQLSNGGIFTIGGSWSGGEGGKNGEYYDPDANTWTLRPGCPVDPILTNDRQGVYRQDNHAWLFARQNGSVFQAGPSTNMNWFTTDGEGSTNPAGPRGDDTDSMNGNAVMYDAVSGKILTVGGAPDYENSPATANANIITIGQPNEPATVTALGNAKYARAFHNSVVLPDGKVVVIGGQNYARTFNDDTTVFEPELFDPETGCFTVMAPMSVPRNYHSVAILLPDATVLSAGGGLCGEDCTVNHPDGQIFTPPYLLDADMNPAPRPTIQATVPETDVCLGSTVGVTVELDTEGGSVCQFSMVRFGSATHSVNTDQRRVPLDFAEGEQAFEVLIPSDPGVVVPGWWMLFAINANGVPSVAKLIHIQ